MNKYFKMNNGIAIPAIGFGTWQTPDGDIAIQSVEQAIKVGYRHIDTAAIYGNEQSIGSGIKKAAAIAKTYLLPVKYGILNVDMIKHFGHSIKQ